MTKLTVLDAFGAPMEIEAEIGDAKIHGYILPSGAWALYRSEGSVPCAWVALRKKRKRKFSWWRKDFIIAGLPS